MTGNNLNWAQNSDVLMTKWAVTTDSVVNLPLILSVYGAKSLFYGEQNSLQFVFKGLNGASGTELKDL